MNFQQIVAVSLVALAISSSNTVFSQSFDDIGDHYADLAVRVYGDSYALAKNMAEDIQSFLDLPNAENLARAKSSWSEARKVYGITEVFRFSHPVVDEWEPQVNAWPLDEGFIDYVDGDNYYYELGNPVGKANLIANKSMSIGPTKIDLNVLTPELLAGLNEAGGTEANVATGWHAVEFLLWGQDLNGTSPGAGQRPYSDFLVGEACTNENCNRRRQYLQAVTKLLISDLEFIVAAWSKDKDNYRAQFDAMSGEEKMRRILYGIGSLSLGELAGERMKVALYANSPEDEHDCFSDTTHNTLYANAMGVVMALDGKYRSVSGELIEGPSLVSWAAKYPELSSALSNSSANALDKLKVIVDSAKNGQSFDQLIAPDNDQGAQKINDAINGLVEFTRNVELLANRLELGTLNPDNAGHEF